MMEVFVDIQTDETPKPKRIRKEKKPDLITLNLPRKTLCKLTARLARRYNISPLAQTAFWHIIKIGRGNLDGNSGSGGFKLLYPCTKKQHFHTRGLQGAL